MPVVLVPAVAAGKPTIEPATKPTTKPIGPRRGFARFNPLAGLKRPKDIIIWGLFETANHSFTLLIITLLFPIYYKNVIFTDSATGVADPDRGDFWWNITYAISSLILVGISPIVGALADARGIKRQLLVMTALTCVVATLLLFFVGPGHAAAASMLFVIGNIAFVLGENLIAAFLPQLCDRSNIGRVSALGWALGYAGGVVVLLLALAMMEIFNLKTPASWGPLFLLAGVWFLVIAMPTLVFLKDRDPPSDPQRKLNVWTVGFVRVAHTFADRARFSQLFIYLGVFLLYMSVVQVMIANAGNIAKDYGFNDVKLVVFVLQITVVTCIGAVITGIIEDKLGHRRTIMIALVIWVLVSLSLALIPAKGGQTWLIWVLGNAIGLGMGMIGTSSRALVGSMTPRQRTAEFFGLWGLTLKMAGFVGPGLFAVVKYVGSPAAAFFVLTALSAVAFVLMLFVDPQRGAREASAAELAGS